ncbi:hypothetical protein BDF20DRAFT_814559 [Mycotypha africana]|uniref:uncharacterized protein n=1 Tax=Mycotypha africana TaxID=64632 RepID=UPI0023016E10|nr:uncharacterized protein BDF20DRAFT_814559 [Mycotypha africana]KAI8988174.1 hypothetical protein BDF20DRAFT_814559 [Mycotypha africana]
MGVSQSRNTEPIIFYNQNTSPLYGQQQPAATTSVSSDDNEKIEKIVRQRVMEELRREKDQREQNHSQKYEELAKKNIENDLNSVAIAEDIENMIEKLKRSVPADIPTKVAQSQEALIVCYK